MTRIVKIEKTGGPEVLKLETITLEKPSPEEVTIEHKAIGLNFIDTYHRSGLYPLELPSGIGAEGAGIIKKIGSKVEGFSPNTPLPDQIHLHQVKALLRAPSVEYSTKSFAQTLQHELTNLTHLALHLWLHP